MGEADFVPFVAPRARTIAPPPSSDTSQVVEEPNPDSAQCVAADAPTNAHEGPRPETPLLDEPCATPDANPSGAQAGAAVQGESFVCDHSIELRNEAIRLAAIACGRALRHALVLHPRIIAAFVDDALAAAGKPRHARIRVHPGCLEHISADHDPIGDEHLEVGDVVVEFEGVSLGADLFERARLLASSADA